MTGARYILPGLVVAACVTQVAHAQTSPGTPQSPPASYPAPVARAMPAPRVGFSMAELYSLESGRRGKRAIQIYETATAFARCTTNLGAGGAARLLSQTPGSSDERRAAIDLAGRYRGCAVGSATVPVIFIRGAIAETQISRDVVPALLPDVATTIDSDQYLKYFRGLPAMSTDDRVAKLERTSQCRAILAPGMARRVLKEKPGSSKEAGALKSLYAATPVCGGDAVPRGIISPILRGVLAEGLYHWLRSRGALIRA